MLDAFIKKSQIMLVKSFLICYSEVKKTNSRNSLHQVSPTICVHLGKFLSSQGPQNITRCLSCLRVTLLTSYEAGPCKPDTRPLLQGGLCKTWFHEMPQKWLVKPDYMSIILEYDISGKALVA